MSYHLASAARAADGPRKGFNPPPSVLTEPSIPRPNCGRRAAKERRCVMSEQSLPDSPNLDWLRKQAKRRLDALRKANPDAKLAAAQFDLAKEYGFSSWRALKAHVDSLTVDGQLIDAARSGDAGALAALLDEHPEKLHV